MIKDHLGNVRMVLTEEVKPAAIYQATIEDGVRAFENKLFDKIPQTEAAKPTTPSPGFDSNSGNEKVIKLFNVSGTDQRIGPGVVLKVMAGDKINAKVQAWYPPSATDNTVYTGAPVLINGLINALSGGLIGAGSKGTLGELSNVSGVLNTPISSFLSDPDRTYTSSKPKAYLNWVLLDEQQFKYVDIDNNSGAVQIHSIGTGEQKKLVEANGGSDITIAKNGYIYVYVSNESQGAVYFDDLRVEHTAGAILEETHYYPFGLTMAGISSKAAGSLENKRKWNKGSELHNKEFSDGSGLELYATPLRSLDPQLGRWWQIDPKPDYSQSLYAAMGNNPVLYNDPLGDTTRPIGWSVMAPTNTTFSPLTSFIYQGSASIQASNARAAYNTKVDQLADTDKAGRAKLKVEARNNTPEPFKSVIEQGRPIAAENAKVEDPNFKGNATKTNPEVNEMAKTTGALGKIFIGAAAVQSTYTIATSDNPVRETATEGFGWAGAMYVGGQFATAGTATGGPVGGVLGGVVGSGIGFVGGKKAGDAAIEAASTPRSWQFPIIFNIPRLF